MTFCACVLLALKKGGAVYKIVWWNIHCQLYFRKCNDLKKAMLQRSSLLWLAVLICTWKYGEAQNSPPIFSVVIDSVSFLEFEEEDANFTIYDADATDLDGDTITYYIPRNSLNSDKFRVDNETGEVFPQAGIVLDREALAPDNAPLRLFIAARDGNEHDTDDQQFELLIIIQDRNDNHPSISRSFPLEITVAEDTPSNSELLTVEATDEDDGANALVFYYLQTNTTLFSLERQTGILRLLGGLDYDNIDTRTHGLVVIAEDQGVPSLMDSRTLTVTTTDANDLDPVFEPSSYSKSIYENTTQGYVIERVMARDGDTGINDDVIFSLEDEGNSLIDGQLSFIIDNVTGEISVNVSLDRETHPSYTLTVKATEVNDSSKVAMATVLITVVDNNDNLPQFEQDFYTANVSELESTGRTVLTVSASDRDTGPNAEFMYQLENLDNTSSLPFTVSPEGAISLSDELDFEETEYYLFRVLAVEEVGGANNSATVIIYVENENDVSPVFEPAFYNATIVEGADEGAFIHQVMASDGDRGVFGEITYSLISGDFDDFYINTTAAGGAVHTSGSLDYETRPSYTIIVQATDTPEEGMEARTAAVPAELTVDVININDNPPVFDRSNLTVELDEESEPGTVVATLRVTDDDGEDFTETTFTITDGNHGNFTFDPALENVVITSVELDYDLNPDLRRLELTITVNDTKYTDEITLVVELMDINDNSPVFENNSYQFQIYEEVEIGTEVGEVVATDNDSGDLGRVVYSISDNDKFTINSTTGQITTKDDVDREDQPSYTVTVTATDQDPDEDARRSDSALATIIVLDVNDNSPQFSEDMYEFTIAENTATVELSITATDGDDGTNKEIVYEIINGSTHNAFLINPTSGIVTRNASITLDREDVASYFITVLATDGGTPSNNATATISITISDVNDEEPMFSASTYNATIDEDVREDTIVVRLTASDSDTAPNAMLQYQITSIAGPPAPASPSDPTPPSGSFIIDETLGDIRTQGMFDREAFEGPYVLQVTVTDNGVGMSLTGTAEVTVYLADVNDNDPIFQPTTFSVTLDEELPENQTIAVVMATDGDTGSNKELYYTISSVVALNNIDDQSTVASHFSVDPVSGLVVTNASLDFEFVQRYRITVTATDNGINQRSSSATITVTVVDVNDHTPQFSSDVYYLNVTEATLRNTRFSVLEVTDQDSGENSRLSFTADITSPFSVESETGDLVLTQTLDYETDTLYSFTVNVSDNGEDPRMDSAMVSVVVGDVNDNPPRFQNDSYSAAIPEGNYSMQHRIITQVVATDRDSGVFADVTYELLSGNTDLFLLDSTNGEVSVVAEVDFEALNPPVDATEIEMQLVVQARDGGNPAMTSTVTVTITITDENDNRPVFDGTPYDAVVRENTLPGEEVIVVRASDGDGNQNGVVRYSISDTENFSIDDVTGVITTGNANDSNTTLLYDTDNGPSYYTFSVYATDNGLPSLISSAEVTVTVEDVNDNSPEIVSVSPRSVSVREDISVPYVLSVEIEVRDADRGENAEVEFQLSNDGGLFSVDREGKISVVEELDREAVDEYNITITVTDGGQPRRSDESYLVVTVTDDNDNAPTFEQDTYTAILMENVSVGVSVITLRIRDLDSIVGGAGDLEFIIIRGDSAAFALNATALADGWWDLVVETATTFDYESGPRSYALTIQARDQVTDQMTGTANLTVTILDVNDHPPSFSSSSYTFSMPESLPAGGAVGSVLATDPDGANNGNVTYSFTEDTIDSILSTFSLDPVTGVLELRVPVNFESAMFYQFSVVARDSGSPAMSSSANVRVNVEDINEFAPMFTETEYTKSVPENANPGTVLLVVNANDSETQNVISYAIVTGSTDDFQLGSTSGALMARRAFDREVVAQYILTVQAVDGEGDTGRTGYAQVIITVTDVNDVTPSFPFDSFTYFIPESSPPTSPLSPSMMATDTDAGSNGLIDYRLQPPTSDDQPFEVDMSTGVISLAAGMMLDHEHTPNYTLVLQAVDRGSTPRTGSIVLTVIVSDVNDRPPSFDQPSYSATVPENSPEGVSVISVTATDEDSMDTLVYDITDGDEDRFQIDSTSGLISTGAVPLDREEQAVYTLTVTVTDFSLRTDEVEVVVTLRDLNDNRPVFTSSTYSSTQTEDNTNSLVVASVSAMDRDEGSNGRVRYYIVGGNSDGVFSIDSTSGEVIALAGRLDYESQQLHTLTIEAIDQAEVISLRLFSTAVLTVQVEDINDNRPMFSQDEYRTTVTENAALGTTVAIISATDGDSGSNGEVTYGFGTTSSAVFSINSTTGVVTVSGDVNFEMGQEHELSVEARDSGNPQRSHVVPLHIVVINADDENPRFPISFYTAAIDEDEGIGTHVLTVTATDPDAPEGSPSTLSYSIIQSSSVIEYFLIDTQTGEISTARSLDREMVAVVDLQVIATDSAGHNGTATVQITIGDVNDNAPKFLAVYYTASLRENSAVGTTIIPFFKGNSTRVEARDIDGPGLNSEISYDKEGEDSDKFSVDKNTGIVTVAPGAVLDREEDDTLILVITAEDHGSPENTGSVTMTITLLDENDNPPTFVPPFGYAVVAPEDEPVGSVLLVPAATDPDLFGGGQISFRKATSSPLSKLSCFSVNSTTGAIRLEDSLDRETDSLVSLIISAHDNGEPSLVTSTTVQITVTDVNDNPPQFSQEAYIATVSEQHTLGAPVVTVVADDPDSGTNGQVEYAIASHNSAFTVNPDTGEVSTILPLDYETQRTHDIIVEACDKGEGMNCSTAEVTVYVLDFNDEFPLFDFSTYRTDLCHTHSPNEVFMQPVAIDMDSGSNAQLTYSLEQSDLDLINVQPDSGRIFLVRGVALEDVGSEFTAVIRATDGGSPRLFSTTRIEVHVLNCTNDTFRFERPFFERSAMEGAAGILNMRINTLPEDEGNAVFSPELPNNPFTWTHNFIMVTDGDSLDRETRDFYSLPIMSTSRNGDNAYATVTITIMDVNDNVPQLRLPDLSFTIAENTSEPVYVTTAVATDDDESAAIVFSFTINNAFFAINETSGVVSTTTELDREVLSEHQLTIQASDGTFVSEPITITVAVSDVNDNSPDFSEEVYYVTVVENSPAGASVLTVVATDDDEGENAAITFSIVDGDINLFSLNSETGVVRTSQALDYETQSQYSLTVRATDNGAPILSSDAEINITVLDFNDHTPIFLNPVTSVSVSEGVAPGTILTDFNVTDSDSGLFGVLGVVYSIVAGDTDLFSVNSVSGILRTEGRLDRDTGPACHFLSIQATDSAGANSLSNVTEIEVCVIDENDNCPNFTQATFSGQVPEDETTNQRLLLRVQATDADSDKSTNGDVVYELLEDGGVFDIDPSTGFLSLTSTLDTESISSYVLVVEACDRGEEPCCTNTTIAVDVLDINDNKPVIHNILPSNNTINVVETDGSCGDIVQTVGDVIFTVNASDVDSGASGAVIFNPLDGVDGKFHLSEAGVITISGTLDYEARQNYQLHISARDQGSPSLVSDTAILFVNVVDVNDETPFFPSETSYVVSQDEGTVPEAQLIQVIAMDDDTVPQNADVTYSITSGNTSIFTIDNNGNLFLMEELDCETTSSYTLTVTANNSLSVCPKSASVTVSITVNDINDNSPMFTEDSYYIELFENITIPSPVLTIEARDGDKNPPNNDLLYTLKAAAIEGLNPFQIDDNNGEVTVTNPLDAESLPGLVYNLTVTVEDKGLPAMSNSTSLVVSVMDVNDEPPLFSQATYSVSVSEGVSSSPSLLSLSFTDGDILEENRVSQMAVVKVTGRGSDGSYRDLGTGSELFFVSENNTLQLLAALDREDISSYDIIVTVTNTAPCYLSVGSGCSSTAVVVVTVTDVNDNQPKFIQQSYSGEVSVTASPGTSVLTVAATDLDTGSFGEVRYRFDSSIGGRFRIDEVTGIILTRGSFENLDGQSLSLTVTAYDNLGNDPSLSSTASINIVVLNDFQRISVLFSCGIETVAQSEQLIIDIIANASGLNIHVENYQDHSDEITSNFIFHATDPETNEIVDFDEFFARLEGSEGDQGKEAELIAALSRSVCLVEEITAFANINEYQYPDALDTPTIIIFVLCVIMTVGAFTTLVLSLRQRWVALHDTRSKLLADVFYGSPGSTSLVENVHQEDFQLEEMKGGNRQNPMFVQPYDNWEGVDASGPESTGDVSSMNRENPLYESQEIRMEMFADVSEEEEGDEADEAQLLAAALKEDEEPEDNSVTAI